MHLSQQQSRLRIVDGGRTREPVWTAPAGEPGREILARMRRHLFVALTASNLAGAAVTFLLGTYVVPSVRQSASNIGLNAIAFAGCMVVGVIVGTAATVRVSRAGTRWLAEDRTATAAERVATLRFPFRQTVIEAVLWAGAAVVFVAVNAPYSGTLSLEAGVQVVLGGLTTCALTYLLAERLSRPGLVRMLETCVPDGATGPAMQSRMVLTWAFGSAVPLIAVVLLGAAVLAHVPASRERIGLAVVLVGLLGVIVGLTTIAMSVRHLALPLRSLRAALARVEDGELDVAVPIEDAGELGLLQASFNKMAAGLRDRERMRDLFGRHVGHEVVREALEREEIALGGEVRDAGVLFVDVIGSTTLAATHDPTEVVTRLNEFFAVVVDCVSLHGGWVNKFEGDAVLCVFGAPTAHPDPAGSALATARALRERLDRELDGIEAAIGVSAGRVVAGNMGAAERFEYTVIGDPVNEAARLTELAKTTDSRLIASNAALVRAGDKERVRWRADRTETLRGRTEPTRMVVLR